MAIKTGCQTPGVVFHTKITPARIECVIDLPTKLELSAQEAGLLDANLHNALELVLAKYFAEGETHEY